MPDRTSIVIPAALKKQAMARARHEGISFGAFVRESVKEKLARPRKKTRGKKDPFWSDIAVYDGPVPADFSINHDKYLYGEEE